MRITVARIERDAYGQPVDGAEETYHTIDNVAIAPRQSDELHGEGRAGVIVGLTAYVPAGGDLLRTDDVIIPPEEPNAGRYLVEGEPGTWKSPYSGQVRGLEVALRRAEG
jgi:hypothetical protein